MGDSEFRNIAASQVGKSAEATIDISADTLYRKRVILRTGTAVIWDIGSNTDARSGSNAGDDLEIRRYDDDGTTSHLAMKITRSSGRVTLYGRVIEAYGTFAGDDATPGVAGANVFYCAADNTSPLTITALDNPVDGQVVEIHGTDDTNTTALNKSALFRMSADHVLGVGDVLVMRYKGSAWDELSYSTNETA